MESWTVFESHFINEENAKFLVKMSSTTLLCLGRCCCTGSSCLLTQSISQLSSTLHTQQAIEVHNLPSVLSKKPLQILSSLLNSCLEGLIPRMLHARAVQLLLHHQAATLLFGMVWVLWQLRGCSEIIWRLFWAVLDVPTLIIYSREQRHSKQKFKNKYHTFSSSLCDIQWFVKGTKRTSEPMKCIKDPEQTTRSAARAVHLGLSSQFSEIWPRIVQQPPLWPFWSGVKRSSALRISVRTDRLWRR